MKAASPFRPKRRTRALPARVRRMLFHSRRFPFATSSRSYLAGVYL
ncbi:hypothetical protein HMPREF0972_02347 [Actinomyces sp. oral taxon 848 str. F0332]|nr:hypothetical protein HMPREF0972_02347 [Actinomyces sp. oral taxon 848 str. F0332]